MIVMKFGGTSVESADAIRRLGSIVKSQLDREPIVVVSAMGKTTNKLLALANSALNNDPDYHCELSDLRRYHWEVGIQLIESQRLEELGHLLEVHFNELGQLLHGLAILKELTPRTIDAISSYGERLSSEIITMALEDCGIPAIHVDSRDVVLTDNRHTQAAPNLPETYKRLKKDVKKHAKDKVVVMGGFIGSNAEGVTTTLGRGGSDFSAAIVGAGCDVEEIQIWTDVDGMMTTDPRMVPDAKRVKTISYSEAAELAYFGAKVLHPASVRPAIEQNIPVVILNSRRPEVAGTRIVGESVACTNIVKAIACKRNITMVNIHSARMLMAHGFLRRVFEVFDRWETPVDVVTTSEVSVSVTIDDARRVDDIKHELAQIADVSVESGLAILSVVGEGIGERSGIAARVFKALANVNVRMISQGASRLNLSVIISDSELENAVSALHKEFFSDADPEVFE